MNSDLTAILANDPTLQAISALLDAWSSTSSDLDGQLREALAQVQGLNTQVQALTGQHGEDVSAIQLLQNQLADAKRTVTYRDLQQASLTLKDSKQRFQWIQAGNSGNTGGPSAVPHGTITWARQADGSVRIGVNPANIDGTSSDNFLEYMPLPFPSFQPTEYTFECKQFNCASSADWSNCQQLEFWIETIEGGFIYTGNWAIHPTHGLRYMIRGTPKGDQWFEFKPNGVPLMVDAGKPTSFKAVFTVDRVAHTLTYTTLWVNGVQYDANITVPCPKKTGTQLSVSVQLDGKGTAPNYTAILDRLDVSYK